jgi:hypothetical protein
VGGREGVGMFCAGAAGAVVGTIGALVGVAGAMVGAVTRTMGLVLGVGVGRGFFVDAGVLKKNNVMGVLICRVMVGRGVRGVLSTVVAVFVAYIIIPTATTSRDTDMKILINSAMMRLMLGKLGFRCNASILF